MVYSTYNTSLERGVSFRRDFVSRFFLAPSASEYVIGSGSKTFLVQTNLPVAVNDRVRAYSISEPLNFMEGPVTSYGANDTHLVVSVDLFGGDTSTPFSDWQLLASDDLTGVTFDAVMKLSPKSCAGRTRAPITLTAGLAVDPKTGEFWIALTPTQTAALTLGVYDFYVIAIMPNAIDKRQMMRGEITVTDPG